MPTATNGATHSTQLAGSSVISWSPGKKLDLLQIIHFPRIDFTTCLVFKTEYFLRNCTDAWFTPAWYTLSQEFPINNLVNLDFEGIIIGYFSSMDKLVLCSLSVTRNIFLLSRKGFKHNNFESFSKDFLFSRHWISKKIYFAQFWPKIAQDCLFRQM